MAASLLSTETTSAQLKDHIEYSQSGVVSKAIFKDDACQYTLFCLAADTEISEHTATRNATIYAIEGTGTLILNGQKIQLEPGAFVLMPANAPHALEAKSNLAFILTLSAPS